ncbi:MAG: hypothetical protein RMM06_08695, partial [Armatimonadota bacterium]|nr:hypothetical protein [Armatimonadota bacterium]
MRGRATLQGMLVVMLFLSVLGCGGGGDGPPSQPQVSRLQDASGQPLRDTNGNGIPDLPLEARPTIVPSFTGFAPGQAVEIQVFRDGMPLLPEPILLTASPSGDIPPTPVLWDIGVDANGQLVDATGRYSVVASGEGRQVSFSFEILSGRSAATSRQETSWFPHFSLLHGDPFRPVQGSVPVGDRINIGGYRFPPNERVRIYIVRDRDDWSNGAPLEDESGEIEEVTIDSYLGILPATTIWNSAQRRGDGQTDGDYDVVVDVNRNGRYDQGVDVLQYRYGAAFTVQVPSPPGQHLAVELAASQYGVF